MKSVVDLDQCARESCRRDFTATFREGGSCRRTTQEETIMSDDKSGDERKDELTRRSALSLAAAVAAFGAAMGMRPSTAIAQDEHEHRHEHEHRRRHEHEHRHEHEREHRRRHEHEHEH